MSHLMDKVSYLRGLMEGMKLDTSTNEGMLISRMIDVLGDMAAEVADLADAHEELSDFVDTIDEDLNEIEELFADADPDDDDFEEIDDEDDEIDDDELDEECTGDCGSCSGCADDEDGEEEYDGEIFVECMCPECKGAFYVKEDELNDDAFHVCPRCGARIHVVPDYDADIPVATLADDGDEDE